MTATYYVGIDLGTTHCLLSYSEIPVDGAKSGEPELKVLPIPQWVGLNAWAEKSQLPSFLYQFHSSELDASALRTPWGETQDFLVGDFARSLGEQTPDRLIASAKSWLSCGGMASVQLPQGDMTDVIRLTPDQVIERLLRYLADVWQYQFPGAPLAQQALTITIPASFDPQARSRVAEIATALGFADLMLLEEPQAALYQWLYNTLNWREALTVGDTVLVVDMGGGTTDFSLITVHDEDGELSLERVAVGDHLLLGGDNMDLTLAYAVKQKLASEGKKVKANQLAALVQLCRSAKEKLLNDPSLVSVPIALATKGALLLGKTLRTELTQEMLTSVLVDGFFPEVALDAQPDMANNSALSTLALPYAQDAAVTRHLASFLQDRPFPNKVLFNGGVFKAQPFCQRLMSVLNAWADTEIQASVEPLSGGDLDAAVSLGAAYYRFVKAQNGVRIRGGVAHSYYVGIEAARPAVPGMPAPLEALCVVSSGLEEGSPAVLVPKTFHLKVGQPARFRFFGSGIRAEDQIGDLLDEDDTEELQVLPDIEVNLTAESADHIPVQLMTRVTEIGTLEIEALPADQAASSEASDEPQRWRVSLNVRAEPVLD